MTASVKPSGGKGGWVIAVTAVVALVGAGGFMLRHRAQPAPPPSGVIVDLDKALPPTPQESAPTFVRFETPTPKVKIHPVGEGFEVINTDPELTGTKMDFSGVTDKGEKIPYSVKLPPPVANAQ